MLQEQLRLQIAGHNSKLQWVHLVRKPRLDSQRNSQASQASRNLGSNKKRTFPCKSSQHLMVLDGKKIFKSETSH
jgi:hypothetical protein